MRICRFILPVVCFFAYTTPLAAQRGKVILAVFAHPDDEGTVTPVLAKYISEGATVYLAVATDGRYGVSSHTKVPEGDSLAAARKAEMFCAAEKLGARPPILFGLHDQLRMYAGMDTLSLQLTKLHDSVAALFQRLKPDVVITWGPSGWTGHPDHRLVGAVVTEVFGEKVWGKPANLYYPELASGTVHGSPFPIGTTDSAYLPIRITVSEKDYARAKASHDCHQTQYTPQTAQALQSLMWGSQKGIVYFRSYIYTGKRQTTLFP